MSAAFNPDLDLTISRVIKAPPMALWEAWADPARLEQWLIPAPTRCKVVTLDLKPGGGFVTEMSEDGGPFVSHINGCFLAADPGKRLVFTTALTAGWRPAVHPFITAVLSFREHPEGTDYHAHVMHKSAAVRKSHEEVGFYDGWGTVNEQLAKLVEGRRR